MEKNLSDINTYILHRDLINKVINDLKEILKRWLQYKYISSRLYS